LLQFIFTNGKVKKVRGPALFIDRDGVINCRRPGDYVMNWSQFIFMPGIRKAMRQLSSLGLPMIIISNQAGVGKGLLDSVGLQEITAHMRQALLEDGTVLAAAYYCPHRSDENCVCRKPKPGLLVKAAHDFNLDLSRSVLIGDSVTDVQAARAAGCKPVLFGSGLNDTSISSEWAIDLPTALTAKELFDLVAKCLKTGESSGSEDRSDLPSGS
jgi:D-glycero-D-manno-heptose 1,7-bisphosphate phosphatase